jgi:hypothetical protein
MSSKSFSLSREEKTRLLSRFPPLELSYENILHKKVHADLYMLIPVGQKAFVWFSYWEDKDACFVILLNNNNNICDIQAYPTCFDHKLSLNTVIYGTLFRNNLFHFSCERLFYYKGYNVTKYTFAQQLTLFKEMFDSKIKQIGNSADSLILGLPIIKKNFEHTLACINGLPYAVSGVQFYSLDNNSHNNINDNLIGIYKLHKPIVPEAIFTVKPLLDADIYELYCCDRLEPYGIANIPSYKCSVMMNSLFRNIKENTNLDLLEESDDEEEYENNNADKFVDLNKSYNMRCIYNKKLRKWQPIQVVDLREKVSSYKSLLQY